MDKETLSNYGWIVICVLVLAVMIALATPFGQFVEQAVKSTTQGLFDVNRVALNSTGLLPNEMTNQSFDGLNIDNGDALNHKGVIPEGGRYISGATYTTKSYTTENATIYEAGEILPTEVMFGDIYIYGDYAYYYGLTMCYCNSWTNQCTCDEFVDYGGWSAICINNVEETTPILESINNINTTSLFNTFVNNRNLTVAPTIPSTVKDIAHLFEDTSIETYVESTENNYNFRQYIIPEGVVNMSCAFAGTEIQTSPKLPSTVVNLSDTFAACMSLDSAPIIPYGVVDMSGTFALCYWMITYDGSTETGCEFANYVIPDTVIYMDSTFSGCIIDVAPVIPSSVKYINRTFSGCSLNGTVTIHANPIEYEGCFRGMSTKIKITGTSTKLAELAATNSEGKVSVKQ